MLESAPVASVDQAYNVYAKNCPARMVFDRLADKWSLLIVGLLKQEPKRFNQLRREIDGISQKALAQCLRRLERDGVVIREVFATKQISVQYSLSELGCSLAEIIEPLVEWSESNMSQVITAQQEYDERYEV